MKKLILADGCKQQSRCWVGSVTNEGGLQEISEGSRSSSGFMVRWVHVTAEGEREKEGEIRKNIEENHRLASH